MLVFLLSVVSGLDDGEIQLLASAVLRMHPCIDPHSMRAHVMHARLFTCIHDCMRA